MTYEYHVEMGDESELDKLIRIRILIMSWVIDKSAYKRHINVVVAV